MQPLVSVIMTVYNGERFVVEAVESILQQTWRDFAFVIVDDGSSDRTPELLRNAQADARVVVVSQPRIGRARALNVAIAHSRGIYLANQDADDVAAPDRLEKQIAFLQQHPQVGMVGTRQRQEYPGGRNGRVVPLPLTNSELRRALPRRNPFVHSSVMMRRTVLENVGTYDESLAVSIDYDLWTRIAARYEVANLADALTVQRFHASAFFQNRISLWERFKTKAKVRWRAWWLFSRNPFDLRFVVDPFELAQWVVRDTCPFARRAYRNLTGRAEIHLPHSSGEVSSGRMSSHVLVPPAKH